MKIALSAPLILVQIYSLSIGIGSSGLMLCEQDDDATTSAKCKQGQGCSPNEYCYPGYVWASQSGSAIYLSDGVFKGPVGTYNSNGISVRCISDL